MYNSNFWKRARIFIPSTITCKWVSGYHYAMVIIKCFNTNYNTSTAISITDCFVSSCNSWHSATDVVSYIASGTYILLPVSQLFYCIISDYSGRNHHDDGRITLYLSLVLLYLKTCILENMHVLLLYNS